jgi:branched-chain amino acid transport system permease protein
LFHSKCSHPGRFFVIAGATRRSNPATQVFLSLDCFAALAMTALIPDQNHVRHVVSQQILNGLLDGVYYLLIALGLSLIFSLGGIVNLAHGAFYAIGAYLTLVLLALALGFGGASSAPVAVGAARRGDRALLFRRFYRSDPILSLLLTFGLAMVAEQALRMIFGAPPLSYSIPPGCAARSSIGDFIYSFYRAGADRRRRRACVAGLVGCSAAHLVRPRGARRRAEPGHGRRARHLAAALHGGGRGARHRACGLAGVLLAPIYRVHPAMGAGDHHAGLRRRGDRRPRLVLGRGRRALLVGLVKGAWSASAIPRPRPPRSIC